VGVDVERVSQDVPVLELARRFLSAEAVAVLAALPTSLRRLAFFKCWTAGEAFSKARGTGLDEEGDGFGIGPRQDGVRVVGTASNWSLSELQLPDGYVGAVVSENRASVARLDRSPDGGDGAGAIALQAWLWRKPLVARLNSVTAESSRRGGTEFAGAPAGSGTSDPGLGGFRSSCERPGRFEN